MLFPAVAKALVVSGRPSGYRTPLAQRLLIFCRDDP